MNKLILLTGLIVLCFWTACDDEEPSPSCITLEQNANWITESFKTLYDIQFPANYEGIGMVGFEGNFFAKNRTDSLVYFSYNYCAPLYCEDFGDLLADPVPASIEVISTGGGLLLSQVVEFCDDTNEIFAILYHDTAITSTGRLYIKQGNDFLEALSINYDQSTQQEVEDIIKTISEN